MKTITIPSNANPFKVMVNGVEYSYPAGTEQTVSNEVADVIENMIEAEPKEAPIPGLAGQILRRKPIGDATHQDFAEFDGYGDTASIYTIKDVDITMDRVAAIVDGINEDGKHAFFDTAALGSSMYLCTIYIDHANNFYRISDMVTGLEKTGFYAASDKLIDIIKNAQTRGNHYTVRWNKVLSTCERLNDAANITTTTTNFKHSGSKNASYDNPFDYIYPWSGRKLCNIDIDAYMALQPGQDIADCIKAYETDDNFDVNDANGVWVYTPAFFGRTFEVSNYRYFDVTDEVTPGNIAYPAMITGSVFGVKVSRTINGETKNCLLPVDGIPACRYAVSTMHTEAKNYGAQLRDVYQLDASLLLMIVEYANHNSQTAIGNGCDNLYKEDENKFSIGSTGTVVQVVKADASATCIPGAVMDIGTSKGGTQVGSRTIVSVETDATDSTKLNVTLDSAVTVTTNNYWSIHGCANVMSVLDPTSGIGSQSGYIGTNGKCNAFYRGEVLWGNKYFYLLGAYRQKDTAHIWIAGRGECNDYDALDTAKHIDTGLTLPAASGYIGVIGIADSLAVAPFATAVGGSSSAPVGDYVYVPAVDANNTVALVGGYANPGSYAGAFCASWYSASSNSNWNCSAVPTLKTP